ncbi:glycerol kinase, partial [Escherichia coli]
CGPTGEVNYALEGAVFMAGASIQWLRDEMKLINDSHDISLRVIPTKYPSGGAKQLTYILTGKQVPHG